uniref:Uncharacterized protein n=1 Tax=Anguilla anguilla TaxID=7936 RepID=A0A0E9UZI7_ANGAN
MAVWKQIKDKKETDQRRGSGERDENKQCNSSS